MLEVLWVHTRREARSEVRMRFRQLARRPPLSAVSRSPASAAEELDDTLNATETRSEGGMLADSANFGAIRSVLPTLALKDPYVAVNAICNCAGRLHA